MAYKEKNNDNYDLPTGVILPEDASANYPDWKKGIIAGIICGIICGIIYGIILAVTPLSKEISNKIGYGILAFIGGFLMLGSIVAFRPPKN